MTTNTTVSGVAAYLEFVKADAVNTYVYQILVTPEGLTNSGATLPMTAYRRRISTFKPRTQWKQFGSSIRSNEARARSTSEDAVVSDMLQFLTRTFSSFNVSGYALRSGTLDQGAPILVEVTQDDLDDVRLGKTPYKVLGRVWKARKAANFPDKVLPS